jgi:3-deoxy-D-manno-octulosonate 8-phosphate phosphatase (KDO 8-P phosphatase)
MAEIRFLCLDVDGVLTDGRLYMDAEGRTSRAFHTQDGLAIRWFERLGGVAIIVTGKQSHTVQVRAAELGIQHVIQSSDDKLADLRRLIDRLGGTVADVAAVGDDLPDLPVMRACGLAIAVANAVDEVKAAARYVTKRSGGQGAVREAIEHILRRSGRWEQVLRHYEGQGEAWCATSSC